MSKEELKERGWEFKYDILNEQKFQKGDIDEYKIGRAHV